MKYKHRNIVIAALLCAGLLVSIGSAATASATSRPAGAKSQPTQTLGTAIRYGTSAPVPKSAARAVPRARPGTRGQP